MDAPGRTSDLVWGTDRTPAGSPAAPGPVPVTSGTCRWLPPSLSSRGEGNRSRDRVIARCLFTGCSTVTVALSWPAGTARRSWRAVGVGRAAGPGIASVCARRSALSSLFVCLRLVMPRVRPAMPWEYPPQDLDSGSGGHQVLAQAAEVKRGWPVAAPVRGSADQGGRDRRSR